MYKKSIERREKLGLNSIREHIQTNDLKLHQFPHAEDINKVIPIFASSSLDRPVPPSESETVQINGRAVEAGDGMGGYEMRYGQGSTSVTESTVRRRTGYREQGAGRLPVGRYCCLPAGRYCCLPAGRYCCLPAGR